MSDYSEHFRQILLEGCVRSFCEPFGRQALSGEPERGFAGDGNLRANEQMRHVGHAGDTVTKGESRARVEHEKFKGRQREVSHYLRPIYRSRPFTSAAIFRSATERLSIQKPQSGWAKRTRPGPSAFSARSRARAISSGVST